MARLKHSTTTVDTETGELVTVSKTFSVKASSEKFYMVFIDQMAPLFGLKNPSDRKLLDTFCKLAEFNTGKVRLTSSDRKVLCKELDISSQTLSNSISSLKKLGLISGDGGTYEVSPIIFWKGTTDAREKLLKDNAHEIIVNYRLKNKDYE